MIEGVAYAMSPAPTRSHQRFVVDLVGKLYAFLKGRPCELLVSPIDVFLPASSDEAEDEVDTIVQPDVIVVCDGDKLIDKDPFLDRLSASSRHWGSSRFA